MSFDASNAAAVGRVLRGLREERGLSQETLAARSGLDRTYVGMVERGERNPTLATVAKLLRVFGVSWTELGRALDGAGLSGGSPDELP